MDLSRISACSYPLRQRPLPETLRIIAAAGYEKVDLLGTLPHFSVDSRAYDVDQLERLCAALGLRIANLGTYFGRPLSAAGASDDIQAELAAARRGLDLAVRLGARSIRAMPGNDRTHETAFALVPFLRELAREAETRGVYVGVETHGGVTSDAPAMVELCREVGSRHFGVLYDASNLMGAGVDYRQAYETFCDHVVHVHVKDGRRVDGKWQRTMLGEGEIDVRWITARLVQVGYDGDLALEYEVNDIEPPESGLAKWRKTIEELLR